jgi:hypothetical protein
MCNQKNNGRNLSLTSIYCSGHQGMMRKYTTSRHPNWFLKWNPNRAHRRSAPTRSGRFAKSLGRRLLMMCCTTGCVGPRHWSLNTRWEMRRRWWTCSKPGSAKREVKKRKKGPGSNRGKHVVVEANASAGQQQKRRRGRPRSKREAGCEDFQRCYGKWWEVMVCRPRSELEPAPKLNDSNGSKPTE